MEDVRYMPTAATSGSFAQLAAALAKAQGQMKAAEMDGLNPHFKSRYATLANVWDAARKPLSDNGLSLTQIIQGDALITLLMHESGEWLQATYELTKAGGAPQQFGSELTYARRYSLSALVGIISDEDDDANAASQKAKPTKKEQVYITDALGEIAGAASLEDLNAIGQMFKDKAPVIQNALRGAFIARRRQLQEQQDAAGDTQLPGGESEPTVETSEV